MLTHMQITRALAALLLAALCCARESFASDETTSAAATSGKDFPAVAHIHAASVPQISHQPQAKYIQSQQQKQQQQQQQKQQQIQQQNLNKLHDYLNNRQRLLVDSNPGSLFAVARAIKMTIYECKYQMRHEHWDCPIYKFSVKPQEVFGKLMSRKFKETSFAHTLLAAAITHSVARACTESKISTCSKRQTRDGGFSEDIDFGSKFSEEFMAAMHSEHRESLFQHNKDRHAGGGGGGAPADAISANNSDANNNDIMSNEIIVPGNKPLAAVSSAAATASATTTTTTSSESNIVRSRRAHEPLMSERERMAVFIDRHNDEVGRLVSNAPSIYNCPTTHNPCPCDGSFSAASEWQHCALLKVRVVGYEVRKLCPLRARTHARICHCCCCCFLCLMCMSSLHVYDCCAVPTHRLSYRTQACTHTHCFLFAAKRIARARVEMLQLLLKKANSGRGSARNHNANALARDTNQSPALISRPDLAGKHVCVQYSICGHVNRRECSANCVCAAKPSVISPHASLSTWLSWDCAHCAGQRRADVVASRNLLLEFCFAESKTNKLSLLLLLLHHS